MNDRDIRITGNMYAKSAGGPHLLTLRGNASFCNGILKKTSVAVLSDERDDFKSDALVYDFSGKQGFDKDLLQPIIDLLLQLRAAKDDQNVFVQNNTVVRRQILGSLKSELLRIRENVGDERAKEIEIVSNNLFDEDTLNDLIKSLIEDSKKKVGASDLLGRAAPRSIRSEDLNVSDRIFRNYTRVVNVEKRYYDVVNKAVSGRTGSELAHGTEPRPRDVSDKRDVSALASVETYRGRERSGVVYNVVERRRILAEYLGPFERVRNLYSRKEIVDGGSRIFESDSWDEYARVIEEKRDLNYLVNRSVKDKYDKVIEESVNKILLKSDRREARLINRKIVNDLLREREDLKSEILERVDRKAERVSTSSLETVKTTEDKSVISLREVTERNRLNLLAKTVRTVSEGVERDEVLDRSRVITYAVKETDRVEARSLETTELQRLIEKSSRLRRTKKSKINVLDVDSISLITSRIEADVVNKYAKTSAKQVDEILTEHVSDRIELINKETYGDSKIRELSEDVKRTREVLREREVRERRGRRLISVDERTDKTSVSSSVFVDALNKIRKISESEEKRSETEREYTSLSLVNRETHGDSEIRELREEVKRTREVLRERDVREKRGRRLISVDERTDKTSVSSGVFVDALNKIRKISESEEKRTRTEREYTSLSLVNGIESINRDIKEKNVNVRDIAKKLLSKETLKTIKRDVTKVNRVKSREILFSREDFGVGEVEYIDPTETINKNYLHKNVVKEIVTEKAPINKAYDEKKILERILGKRKTTRVDATRSYDATTLSREVESVENVVRRNLFSIDERDVNEKIRIVSENVVESTINRLGLESVNKRFIREKVDLKKGIKENLFITPIEKRFVKKSQNMDEYILKRVSRLLPPEIRKRSILALREKESYREVDESKRYHYDDLQRNIGSRIFLNRINIPDFGDGDGEIPGREMIYKEPVDIESLISVESKPKKDDKRALEPDVTFEKKGSQRRTAPAYSSTEEKKSVPVLTERDVIDIVEAYMDAIDVEEISNTVIERVEKETLSQRRRSGIIDIW